jgi:hypothetical protein
MAVREEVDEVMVGVRAGKMSPDSKRSCSDRSTRAQHLFYPSANLCLYIVFFLESTFYTGKHALFWKPNSSSYIARCLSPARRIRRSATMTLRTSRP